MIEKINNETVCKRSVGKQPPYIQLIKLIATKRLLHSVIKTFDM